MLLEINIEETDIKNICETVMTVDEMYNTLQGRIYCAIAKAVINRNQQKLTEKTAEKVKVVLKS